MTDFPLLEIQNVTCFRGTTRVFNNLSLTVNHGESVAILGPNGSGKTTLLKLLCRDIYPVVKDGSFVKINNSERISINELRQHIGVVSQDLQERYTPYSTGHEVVLSGLFGAIGMHPHMEVSTDHLALVDRIMNELGLAALHEKMFQHMSSGQQRRMLLARAIINQPDTFILDEPTNSLDVQAAFSLIKMLRNLIQQGSAILLATHHVEEILPEIERVVLIKDGELIADGPKKELFTNQCLSELYDTRLVVMEQNGFYHVAPAD